MSIRSVSHDAVGGWRERGYNDALARREKHAPTALGDGGKSRSAYLEGYRRGLEQLEEDKRL
jgi:hypothetical protein